MKPDKKQIGMAAAVSGLAAVGIWLASRTGHPGDSAPPVSEIHPRLAGTSLHAPTARTLPPGAARMVMSSGTNASSDGSKRPATSGRQTAGAAQEVATTAGNRFTGSSSRSEIVDHRFSGARTRASDAAQPNEPPAAQPAPSLRAMTAPVTSASASAASADSTATAEPVVLEFADHQHLPAVLVAGETSSPAHSRQTVTAAMSAAIAQEFVAAVTNSSASSAISTPASTVGPVSPATSESSAPDASSENHATGADPVTPDQRWDAAANLADGQYRLLIGQDEYQRKSIQAAILKLEQSTPVP